MGTFSEETLKKFNQMCGAGIDFGEEAPYDFAMCLMANGDIYGIEPGEKCKKGKSISDSRAKELRGKSKSKDRPDVRMAKLKKAFLKKTGREMTKEELAKASWMVNKGK